MICAKGKRKTRTVHKLSVMHKKGKEDDQKRLQLGCGIGYCLGPCRWRSYKRIVPYSD